MRRIECSSSNDLLGNIDSDVEMVLLSTQYDISDMQLPYDKNVFYTDTYIGPFGDRELILRNISNLSLIGKKNTSITSKYVYANVLTFIGCENIKLENLTIGHMPQMGGCRGGVLVFKDCKKVSIENCVLFGCGTIGIACDNCRDFYVQNSKIIRCNTELVYMNDSESMYYQSCEFSDNDCREITILHSDEIVFKECIFKRNEVAEWSSIEKPLLHIGNSSGRIVMQACALDIDRSLLVNDMNRLTVE